MDCRRIAVGDALEEIRERRLYRELGFKTILSDCLPRLPLGRRQWLAVWQRQVRWARTRLRLPVWPLVALEPLAGLGLMYRRRPAARKVEDLASGPGKLTLAMGITRRQNGADVTRGALVVRELCEPPAIGIQVTPRIGITKCADLPLRFLIRGNGHVSGDKKFTQ